MSDFVTEFPPDLCPMCKKDIDYECGCHPREFFEHIQKLRGDAENLEALLKIETNACELLTSDVKRLQEQIAESFAPCRKCSSPPAERAYMINPSDVVWDVYCESCGCEAVRRDTRTEARAAWNLANRK